MNTIPQFLNEFLKSQYEENIAKNIINGYSKNRPVTLRANTLKTNIDYIKNIFTKLNISYINVPWYSDALILKNISEEQLKNLDIYKNGFIYLQSLSSMIPPIILNPQENENILDMTAAPGGKTTEMLALSNNKSFITACEKNKIRAERLKYNINKQGANKVNVMLTDARNLDNFFSFDKILLDVPCMGIGVIKRKPDIKWHRKPEDLKVISKVQYEILENCSKYVKKGGTIIYSTCSILEKENHGIIQKFLEKNPIYTTTEIKIEPTEKQDGFYIAKLIKK